MGLIEGVQQMRLASQQQALAAASTQAPVPSPAATDTAELEPQTRGVVYPLVNGDEKKQMPQQEEVNYEVLPTYEETVTNTTSTRSAEAPYVPTPNVLPKGVSQSLPESGLNEFNTALVSIREGECGGRCRAKRAARDLLKDLANQEAARFEATYRPITCAQRKQIRKDLAPMKSILKAAVREAKRDRVY